MMYILKENIFPSFKEKHFSTLANHIFSRKQHSTRMYNLTMLINTEIALLGFDATFLVSVPYGHVLIYKKLI